MSNFEILVFGILLEIWYWKLSIDNLFHYTLFVKNIVLWIK